MVCGKVSLFIYFFLVGYISVAVGSREGKRVAFVRIEFSPFFAYRLVSYTGPSRAQIRGKSDNNGKLIC